MMTAEFTHDCAQCAALCCMAPVIHKSPRFPIDKPAGEPCKNIMKSGGCKIHATREEQGYLGCIDFTCFGAGQATTQQLFDGKSWLDDEALREPMAKAFLDLFRIQESRWLLQTAEFMGLSAQKDQERKVMLDLYTPPAEGWSIELVEQMLERLSPDSVRNWLRSLSGGMERPDTIPTSDT